MPDTQTLNAMLSTYGASSLLSSSQGGFNWANLIAYVIFGIIGWYAFTHGWKEKSVKPTVLGIVLMVYPYFIANTFLLYAIGIGLTAGVYFWRD